MPIFPQTPYVIFRMTGINSNDPNQTPVFWTSKGTPDFTGQFSGYPVGSIKDIEIDGEPINQVPSSQQYNVPTGPASGDLAGNYPSPTVAKIDGYNLPSPSGTNTVLTYNGTALNWSVATSGTFVAGQDLSGTSSAQTVIGLQGKLLPGIGSGAPSGNLYWNSINQDWELNTSGGSGFTAGGDLSGSDTSQQVAQISGATGNLNFAANKSTPVIGQLQQTSNVPPNNLSINAQYAYGSATGSNQYGGSLGLGAGKSANGNQGAGMVFGGGSNTAASTSSELLIDVLSIYDTVTPRPDLRFTLNAGSSPSFNPGVNNVGTLGTSSYQWNNVYASTITVSAVGSNALLCGGGAFVAPITTHDTELVTSVGGNPAFTKAVDLSVVSSNLTVTGLLGTALPTTGTGYLNWNGSAWVFTTGGGSPSGSAGGDLFGSYPNPYVKGLLEYALPPMSQGPGNLTCTGAGWTLTQYPTFSNDLTGTNTSQTVVGLYGFPLPNLNHAGGTGPLTWNSTNNTWSINTVSVSNGGLGINTVTPNAIVVGAGTSPVTTISPGASGNVLTSNGTAWVSAAAPSGFTAGNDLSGSSTSQTVIGLQGHALPGVGTGSPSGSLYWNAINHDWELNTTNVLPGGTGVVAVNSGLGSAITISQDATLNTSTGALTVSGLQGSALPGVGAGSPAGALYWGGYGVGWSINTNLTGGTVPTPGSSNEILVSGSGSSYNWATTIPAASIPNTAVMNGTYGDNTSHYAGFTVGTDGRITSANQYSLPVTSIYPGTNVSVSHSGGVWTVNSTAASLPSGTGIVTVNSGTGSAVTMGGDATFNTTNGTLTLSSVGGGAATYGDTTHYATFTVDAKGRVIGASSPPVPVTSIVAGTNVTVSNRNGVWTINSSAGSGFTAGGDLTGTSTSQQVAQMSSGTGNLNWAATLNAPSITQTTRATNSMPSTMTIQGQAAYASSTGANQYGGHLILSGGTAYDASPAASISLNGGAPGGTSAIANVYADQLILNSSEASEQYVYDLINGYFYPYNNDVISLGKSGNAWAGIYTYALNLGGKAIPTPSGSNTVLTYNGSTVSWASPSGSGFTAGGDLTGDSTNQEVTGILNKALPSLTSGYLQYTGSAWQFATPSTGIPSGTGLVAVNSGTASAITMSGDATINTSTGAITLKNTGPGATGPVGNATTVPIVTIDAQGRVTALSSTTITQPSVPVTSIVAGTNTSVSNSSGAWTVNNTYTSPVTSIVAGTNVTVSQNGGAWTVNSSGSLPSGATAGQVLVENSGATAATWVTPSGDVTWSTSTAGQVTVDGIQGKAISAPTTASTVATYNGSSIVWSPPSGGTPHNVTVSTLKTANYQITTSDFIVGIGTLTSSITITLPASPSTGDQYIVKDVNGSCEQRVMDVSGIMTTVGYTCTVVPTSGNIDDMANIVISTPYQSATIVYTGSQWSCI